jgi:hypothetical protein
MIRAYLVFCVIAFVLEVAAFVCWPWMRSW